MRFKRDKYMIEINPVRRKDIILYEWAVWKRTKYIGDQWPWKCIRVEYAKSEHDARINAELEIAKERAIEKKIDWKTRRIYFK